MTDDFDIGNALQIIAGGLDELLTDLLGEQTPFVFVVQTDGMTHYLTNVSHLEGTEVLNNLLQLWKANLDIAKD